MQLEDVLEVAHLALLEAVVGAEGELQAEELRLPHPLLPPILFLLQLPEFPMELNRSYFERWLLP